MDAKIVPAKENDLSSILEINKAFFNTYSHDESFFRENIAAGRMLIAHVGDKAVGYLVYQVLWGNTPFLALIRLLPDYRGNGLGTTMLTMCEEKLRTEGYEALISSSEKINTEGNHFHSKTGFTPVGTVQMIYGEEVFYRKDL